MIAKTMKSSWFSTATLTYTTTFGEGPTVTPEDPAVVHQLLRNPNDLGVYNTQEYDDYVKNLVKPSGRLNVLSIHSSVLPMSSFVFGTKVYTEK